LFLGENNVNDFSEQYKAEFEAIFNSITDAVVVVNTDREIVLINPAFTTVFGYQLEQIKGQTTQLIYADPDSYFKQGKIRYNPTTENSNPVYENEYRRKDGTVFFGETLGTHVKDGAGKLHGFLGVIRDVSDRIEAQRQLEESEDRFRALHDATFGGIAIHENGRILDCNQGLSNLTGYANDELVGMDGLKLITPDSVERAMKSIESGNEERYEVEGLRKDGSIYPLSIRGKNVVYKGKDVRVSEFQDITKEKAVERALIEMDQLKSSFISTAAHELRTPLTAIMGYTELLLEPRNAKGFDEETKRKLLHEIYDRGEALNRMIKDFLDVSRIENDLPIPMDLQETNLSDVLRKVVAFYQIHEAEHSFDLILPEEPDNYTIMIDGHRVNQVLENLLSNAVKYSPAGGRVTLRGELAPEGWKVSVEDEGIGMNPEQVNRVFDRFYRADNYEYETEGLGLGMSIVKHIVDAHGGNITVKSEPGLGTNVSFTLPHVAEQMSV
jgi:PAS domain S-box-containing protein